MDKQKRHFLIRGIIGAKRIASQDELRVELKKQGSDVTQATLSRDLHELGVGRVSNMDETYYVLQASSEPESLKPIVTSQVLAIDANESLIVVRTHPACAGVVSEFIDTLHSGEIIGTLAGDNTVVVIPRSSKRTAQVAKFLRDKLIEGK
jgi:transcriptional regulator of arginine metabolism